jgi:hypothetical protein
MLHLPSQGSYFRSLKIIFSFVILCLVDYTLLSTFVLSHGFSSAPPAVMSLPAVPWMLSTTVKVLCSKVLFWNLYFNQMVFQLIVLHLLLVLTFLPFYSTCYLFISVSSYSFLLQAYRFKSIDMLLRTPVFYRSIQIPVCALTLNICSEIPFA